MPTVPQCIYCKRSGVTFNREHVIPDSFGSYGGDTMVLTHHVCQDCNSALGRDLDQILARDSYEALVRAQVLGPHQGRPDRFESRRLEIRFPDHEKFGVFRGARATMDWATRTPKFLDQVLVRDENGEMKSFTTEEMPDADERLFRGRPPGSVNVLGRGQALTTLIAMAESKGARMSPERRDAVPPPAAQEREIEFEIQGFIDAATWRAIAKIAFNYLAFIQGPDYVLDSKFDRIRDFVMGRLNRAMVRLLPQPILSEEDHHWRAFEGHLVLFQTEGRSLKGKVSLFNTITYEVLLCPDLGLIYPLHSGHAFDPLEHRVARIANSPFQIYRTMPPIHGRPRSRRSR